MIRKLFIASGRAYQFYIRSLLGFSCPYSLSCIEHTVDAIKIHGIFKGSFLAVHRVLRCHPGGKRGLDLVPKKSTKLSPN